MLSVSFVPIRPDSGDILKYLKNESASTIKLSMICTRSTYCNINFALRARAMALPIESGICFFALDNAAVYSS